MKHRHFIGMDTHCQFCEVAVVDRSGRLVLRQRCPTGVPALLAVLEQVPRPRALVIEEGPLAGWLWRHLQAAVDEMVVSEPRRNRLIAQEGDKDDDLDAEKLAQLLRGGFLKAVHQVPTLERAVFKQRVALYHHRVRQRVREALRISSLFRQHGVMVREKDFAAAAGRPALLERLPPVAALREMVTQLWVGYDALVEQEEHWRKELIARAQEEEVVRRFRAVPGIGWIRAATWYAYLDTPARFHRLLKGTLLAAALSAVVAGDTPFADLYQRWRDQGLGAKLARRNVARAQAATLWGLWKNGSAYRPEWVGVAAAAPAARPVSG